MSIGITAYGKVVKRKGDDIKNIVKMVGNRCGLAFSCSSDGDTCYLNLTDNGTIYIEFKQEVDGTAIMIDSQTSVMGPGFHRLVADFIDALGDSAGIRLDVEDDTGFYGHRNFKKLETEDFHPWIGKLIEHLDENKEKQTVFAINWDFAWPSSEETGTVIMPFGRFSIDALVSILKNSGPQGIEELIFPCPDEEIDMNRVEWFNILYLLWVKCSFMPSDRCREDEEVNSTIIASIERLICSGKSFPFPHKEYLELCHLACHEPVELEDVKDYITDFPIGFRRGRLVHRIGNVSYTIPGHFVFFDEDRGFGYWNCSEDDQVIHVSAFVLEDSNHEIKTGNDDLLIGKGSVRSGRYYILDGGKDGDSVITHIYLYTEDQLTLFTVASPTNVNETEAMSLVNDFIKGLSATKSVS